MTQKLFLDFILNALRKLAVKLMSNEFILFDLNICFSGIPKFLRSDYGTENCIVASVHIAFHLKNNVSGLREKSYIYGPSNWNIVSNILLTINVF